MFFLVITLISFWLITGIYIIYFIEIIILTTLFYFQRIETPVVRPLFLKNTTVTTTTYLSGSPSVWTHWSSTPRRKRQRGKGSLTKVDPKCGPHRSRSHDQADPNFFMTYFLMAVMYNVKYVVTSLLNLKLKIFRCFSSVWITGTYICIHALSIIDMISMHIHCKFIAIDSVLHCLI